MRWVMEWLGNGFGCSMKEERTCTMRREVGVHLWWMMIWCVRSTKECVTTDLSQFLICPCNFLKFQGLCDIVISHLVYRKVCARWVPKMLTEEHKKSLLHVLWHFWCAITREERACWAILWQDARHVCPISHLNQNSSPCIGSILARRKGKSSSRRFQQWRSCAPYCGTDKVFSW